jgi:hypothetical protein
MKDGLDMTALREVKFLQELHHPNIIQLLDVFSVKQNVNLVLEFLSTDLEAVIRDKALMFQTGDIKSWMAMSLRGLEYIHRNGVLHRVSSMMGACGRVGVCVRMGMVVGEGLFSADRCDGQDLGPPRRS